MQQSLGLVEVVGLTNAIDAADAAVKSANVELIGYELTKGSGLVLIKFCGEVGAVKAAVESAVNAVLRRNGKVYANKVIARVGADIDKIVYPTKNTVAQIEEPESKETKIELKNIEDDTEECSSCLDLIEKAEKISTQSTNKITKTRNKANK